MSDAVAIALITAVASMVTTIISALVLVQSRKNGDSQKATHELVNSRMSELLAAATGQAHAEGIASGEQSQRDRASEAQK
jgi:hypothetical protein